MDVLKQYAKAAAGYILPLLLNMANDLLTGDKPWPQSQQEWLQYLLSSLIVGTTVLAVPNTTTDPKVAAEQSVKLRTGRHALPE